MIGLCVRRRPDRRKFAARLARGKDVRGGARCHLESIRQGPDDRGDKGSSPKVRASEKPSELGAEEGDIDLKATACRPWRKASAAAETTRRSCCARPAFPVVRPARQVRRRRPHVAADSGGRLPGRSDGAHPGRHHLRPNHVVAPGVVVKKIPDSKRCASAKSTTGRAAVGALPRSSRASGIGYPTPRNPARHWHKVMANLTFAVC